MGDSLTYSATDHVGFLEYEHLTSLEMGALSGNLESPQRTDPVLDRFAPPLTFADRSGCGWTPARRTGPALRCGCNIGEMARKVQVKCAIAGCHRRLRMTLAEREELRRVGRENDATASVVCPTHVKAAFNFEFDDIDVDVPLEELLVEASKETPRWRVMLTPLPGAAGERDSQSTPRWRGRVI